MDQLMPQQEPVTPLMMEDIGLDGEGRVAIRNPHVTEGLRVKLAGRGGRGPSKEEAPNTNCLGCNTVENCGTIVVNTVKGCGKTKATL
jgi:hypothetical protein